MEPAKNVKRRRTQYQIMYEILQLAARGSGKTRIMYGANVSYELLVKYLSMLEEKGFLVNQNGHGYQVTDAGHAFMADMARMLRHLGPDADDHFPW